MSAARQGEMSIGALTGALEKSVHNARQAMLALKRRGNEQHLRLIERLWPGMADDIGGWAVEKPWRFSLTLSVAAYIKTPGRLLRFFGLGERHGDSLQNALHTGQPSFLARVFYRIEWHEVLIEVAATGDENAAFSRRLHLDGKCFSVSDTNR